MLEPDLAPAATPPLPPERADLLFYDGGCGLCHRWVVFMLRHDLEGSRFRFAPIGGTTWNETIPASVRQTLPDSLVLRTADGRTLVRSDAVLSIGERLSGGWRSLARITGLLPRWVLDLGYDGIARVRKRLFSAPAGSCPVVPAELRARFLQ